MQTLTACVTKTKCSVAPTTWLATTTLLQQTTTALVPKTTPSGCVVVLVRLTQMRTAFVMMKIHVWVIWTIVVCATVTTLLAPVVRTLLLATTKEPPLTMALVCLQTNVACVVARASQTEHATATATCLTHVEFAAVQVWMRMPTAFATTSMIALVSTTSVGCATAMAALVPTLVRLQHSRLLTP